MQGCPEQGQGVKPPKMGCCQVEGCMELSPALQGEARNRPLAQACSKLKTLYLNSLPFPFFPAWSDPAASPGPGAGPSTRTAGTGESSPEPLARGFCTPQSGPRAPCAPHPRAAPPLSPSSGATEGLHMAEPSSGTTEQRSPRSAFGVSPQGGEHGAPPSPFPACRVLLSFASAEDRLLAGVLLTHAQPDEEPSLFVLLLLLDGPVGFVLQLPPGLRACRWLQAQLLLDHLSRESGGSAPPRPHPGPWHG